MTSISIAITDLAPLCQMDHYNNFPRIACNIWSKLEPKSYNEYKKKYYKKGQYIANDNMYQKMTVLNSKIAANEVNVLSEVRKINKTKNSTADLVSKQEELILKLETSINNKKFNNATEVAEAKQNLDDLKKLVKSSTNVVYGKKNENNGYKIFQRETKKRVRAKQVSMRVAINKTNNITWYLTGIADGLTTTEELIEIKNRRNKLFKQVRDYELCQIQTYLHITKMDLCYLVELINDDNHIIEIERIPNYFEEVIKNNINKFISFMTNLFSITNNNNNEDFYDVEKEVIMDELIRGDPNRFVYSLIYC